jgi:hypothetical protein
MSKQEAPKSASGAGCRKVKCICEHTYQDEKYGKGMRVANNQKDKIHSSCTVCGRSHGL